MSYVPINIHLYWFNSKQHITYGREDIVRLQNLKAVSLNILNKYILDHISFSHTVNNRLHNQRTKRGSRAGRRYNRLTPAISATKEAISAQVQTSSGKSGKCPYFIPTVGH